MPRLSDIRHAVLKVVNKPWQIDPSPRPVRSTDSMIGLVYQYTIPINGRQAMQSLRVEWDRNRVMVESF